MKMTKSIFLMTVFGFINCFGMDLNTATESRKKSLHELLSSPAEGFKDSQAQNMSKPDRLILYSPNESPFMQKNPWAFLPSMSGVQLVGLGVIIGAGAVAYFGIKYCMPRYKE